MINQSTEKKNKNQQKKTTLNIEICLSYGVVHGDPPSLTGGGNGSGDGGGSFTS